MAYLRFLSGPDVDALALSNHEIITAVHDAFRAHGESRVVVEPRTHLVPPNNGVGHFNVLRAHYEKSGVKVVGEIAAGRKPGRERDDERILFWHRGLAIFDIALGLALLRRAAERDIGTMLRYR